MLTPFTWQPTRGPENLGSANMLSLVSLASRSSPAAVTIDSCACDASALAKGLERTLATHLPRLRVSYCPPPPWLGSALKERPEIPFAHAGSSKIPFDKLMKSFASFSCSNLSTSRL